MWIALPRKIESRQLRESVLLSASEQRATCEGRGGKYELYLDVTALASQCERRGSQESRDMGADLYRNGSANFVTKS